MMWECGCTIYVLDLGLRFVSGFQDLHPTSAIGILSPCCPFALSPLALSAQSALIIFIFLHRPDSNCPVHGIPPVAQAHKVYGLVEVDKFGSLVEKVDLLYAGY